MKPSVSIDSDFGDDDEEEEQDGERVLGAVICNKVKIRDAQAFMGCAWRSPITGKVQLTGVEEGMNFILVDLWSRKHLSGTPTELTQDKYIFKPQVLDLRTWIFQQTFEARKYEPDAGEAEPCVLEALQRKCIDSPGNTGGRWSPMMSYTFMLPMVSFTGDLLLMLGCAFVFMLTLLVAVNMNSPAHYRLARVMTLPVRATFLVALLGNLQITELLGKNLYISIFALIGSIACALYDLCSGDISFLLSFSQMCWFEVIRELPNRVYVCRCRGTQMNRSRVREFIDYTVCGQKNWETCADLRLIADVHGVLCELHQIKCEDWEALKDWQFRTGEEVRFAGVNLYSLQRQTIEHWLDPDKFLKDGDKHLVQLKDGRVQLLGRRMAARAGIGDLDLDMMQT